MKAQQRSADDARATRVLLTDRAHGFRPVAERILQQFNERVTRSLGAQRARQRAIDVKETSEL